MKKIFNWKNLICTAAATVLAVGCSSDKAGTPQFPAKEKTKVTDFDRMPKRVTKKVLPIIPSNQCELKLPYDLTATAGTSLDVNVFLAYYGHKPLEIKEWYMFDQYNFEVHYRRIDAENRSSQKTPFKVCSIKPPKGADPYRSGVILNRNNKAVLTVNMPFIGELNPGEKAVFEVYIQTSLRTFKLRSNRMLIRTR